MPMPSVNDLQTMYGAWNPQAYLQAQDNAGLERQFREQQYAQEQEQAKQAGLKTQFETQANPLRIQGMGLDNTHKGLTNTGLDQSNQSAGLKLEREKALQQLNLDADQRKALMGITADQLAQADQRIEQGRRSLDPTEQAHAEKLYQLTGAARALQATQDRKMEETKYKELQDTGRATERNNTSLEVARINQEGQTARLGSRASAAPVSWARSLDKLSPDKQVAALEYTIKMGIDPDTGQPLSELSKEALEARYQRAVKLVDQKPPLGSGNPVLDAETKKLVPAPKRESVGRESIGKRGSGTKDDPIVLK